FTLLPPPPSTLFPYTTLFRSAFHFPVMPRLFMGIRMEDRLPILDILQQTPPIPANCQWAMFLRNHDELTLEMVTDEDRDYMYRRSEEHTSELQSLAYLVCRLL